MGAPETFAPPGPPGHLGGKSAGLPGCSGGKRTGAALPRGEGAQSNTEPRCRFRRLVARMKNGPPLLGLPAISWCRRSATPTSAIRASNSLRPTARVALSTTRRPPGSYARSSAPRWWQGDDSGETERRSGLLANRPPPTRRIEGRKGPRSTKSRVVSSTGASARPNEYDPRFMRLQSTELGRGREDVLGLPHRVEGRFRFLPLDTRVFDPEAGVAALTPMAQHLWLRISCCRRDTRGSPSRAPASA